VFVQRLAQQGLERGRETLLIREGFSLIHALFQNQLFLKRGRLTSMASYWRVTVVIDSRISGVYPKS
jgi:hypothetical protein